MRDLRLPPWLKRIFRSSGLLRGVIGFETEVSGLPICPIFHGQALQKASWKFDL